MLDDPVLASIAIYLVLEECIIYFAGGPTILWFWLPAAQ